MRIKFFLLYCNHLKISLLKVFYFTIFIHLWHNPVLKFIAMNVENKGTLSLKIRSKSMPLVNIMVKSPRNQRIKLYKSKPHEEIHHELAHSRQIFDLQNIKDQQAQEINSKIKVLAERSLKKLEEKYETIDKWKQKYVPDSSILLIRHKLSLDNNLIKINMEDKFGNVVQQQQLQVSQKQKSQLLPIIIKRQIAPMIPDQREQGRRLQQLLKERLEKNKKYYELKSIIIEKQINYFQEMNNFIAPQKKRELQLRKLLLKSQKDRALNRGLFYQKLSLSEPKVKRQVRIKKASKLSQQKEKSSLNEVKQVKIKRPNMDIVELKAKLMQEVVGATPQGWNTANQMDSPEQEDLS